MEINLNVDLINLTKIQCLVINFNQYYEVGNKLIKIDLSKKISEVEITTEKEYGSFDIFDLTEALKFVKNCIEKDEEYQEHIKMENEYDDYNNEGWSNV